MNIFLAALVWSGVGGIAIVIFSFFLAIAIIIVGIAVNKVAETKPTKIFGMKLDD